MAGIQADIYTIEAAVWAALTFSWISLRAFLAGASLDAVVTCPPAALGLLYLALLVTSGGSAKDIKSCYFQTLFGFWMATLTLSLDLASSPLAWKSFLRDPYFSLASVAVSQSFSTVQVLLAGAGASPDPFKAARGAWADVYVASSTVLQACCQSRAESSLQYFLLFLSGACVTCVVTRSVAAPLVLPGNNEIAHLAVESVLFASQMAAVISTLACAYYGQATVFALLIASGLATATLCLRFTAFVTGQGQQVTHPTGQAGEGDDAYTPSAPPQSSVAG
jgi:hypothetical protein